MAKQIPLSCPGHTRPVVDLAFSDTTEQGYFLISASKDAKPMLRIGQTGDWIGTFEGHKGAVWGVTLNRDATQAATAAADFSAKLWDAVNGKEIASFVHQHIVKTVDFSKGSDKLLTSSNEKKMRIFDLTNTQEAGTILEPLGANPRACLWSNNDQNIISGGDEKNLRLWDARTLKEAKSVQLESPALGVELSRDGSVLTVACGKKILFYDPHKMELLRSYDVKTMLNSASLSPDKTVFVAGGEDFILYKFDFATGEQVEYYHGHFGPVHCVRFSPDGELYASGSEDGTLRLWQTTVGKTYGLWKAQESDEKPGIEQNNHEIVSNHLGNDSNNLGQIEAGL